MLFEYLFSIPNYEIKCEYFKNVHTNLMAIESY